MKVTVDVKKLITTLQTYNPNIDLTGVKAYLFDLTVGEEQGSSTQVTISNVPNPAFGYETSGYAEIRSKSSEESAPEFPAGLLGDLIPPPTKKASTSNGSTVSGPTIKVNRGGSTTVSGKDAKVSRREELRKLTDLPSKELVKQLTTQFEKKPKDGNQFVDDGMDSTDGYGDIEIG